MKASVITNLKVLGGFLVAFAGIGYFLYTTYRQAKISTEESSRIRAELQFMESIEAVMHDITDIETSKRGYVITGDKKFLEHGEKALSRLPANLTRLNSVAEERGRTARAVTLTSLINRKADFSRRVIESFSADKEAAIVLIRTGEGKEIMDSIRLVMHNLENEGRLILTQSNRLRDMNAQKTNKDFLTLAFVITAVLLVFYIIIVSDLRKNERARRELQEAGERIRTLYDEAPCGYLSTDAKLNVVQINQTALGWIGKRESEVSGKLSLNELLPGSGELITSQVESGATSLSSEAQLTRKDSGRPVIFDAIIRRDKNGKFSGIRAVLTDNSAQKEAHEQVNYLADLIEKISDAVISTDANHMIRSWNKGAEIIYGYSPEETIGRNIASILRTQRFEKLPGTTANMQADNWKGEWRHVRKDGSLIHVLGSTTELKDSQGHVTGYVTVNQDITPRKLYEESLHNFNRELQSQVNEKTAEITAIFDRINENEKKYRLLFEKNPLPMWIIDVNTNAFLDVNEAAVMSYGYSREEFLNLNAVEIRPEEEREKYLAGSGKHEEGIRHAGRWKHLKKDGRVIDVDIFTNDIIINGTKAQLILANDITEKLRNERALQASRDQLRLLSSHLENIREEERSNIAREIHDELGQQLTGIKMDLSWLLKRSEHADETYVEKLQTMMALVDGTVKTVRKISTELRPGILDDLGLIAALDWQSSEFEKRTGIRCRFHAGISEQEFGRQVSIGIFRIYQEALTNIARHANATEVTSGIRRNADGIELTVRDNGRGFNESEAAGKKTLGLIGMRERAIMLDGTLEIRASQEGGTEVRLSLPLKYAEQPLKT